MPNARGRYWCFTVNNYTPEEEKQLAAAVDNNADVSYIGFGREIGANGTPHLQGYLELVSKLRLGGVRLIAGLGRAHLELRKGSQAEARDYCTKESTDDNPFEEYGTLVETNQGRRNDIAAVRELLDSGASELEIAESHFGSWIRYRKSFTQYANLRNKKVARDVRVMVLFGKPGTGKTRLIFEKEEDLFIAPCEDLKWFDGYNGEKAILIDDYRGGGQYSFLLRLLDRYPVSLPVKGGFVPLQATRIYITSNLGPDEWGIASDHIGALQRRIHKCHRIMLPINFEDRGVVDEIWSTIRGEGA